MWAENEKFAKEIKDILNKFTMATEWADLSNLLERLKKSFKANEKSLVPMKKELAKRLSQCLTPELSMIHGQALDVYKEVFKREKVSLKLRFILVRPGY